jgi:hypothetical protein
MAPVITSAIAAVGLTIGRNLAVRFPVIVPRPTVFFLAEVGTHVQKDVPNDPNWYIVPLCGFHNQSKATTLQIRPLLNLVSANINETCGK